MTLAHAFSLQPIASAVGRVCPFPHVLCSAGYIGGTSNPTVASSCYRAMLVVTRVLHVTDCASMFYVNFGAVYILKWCILSTAYLEELDVNINSVCWPYGRVPTFYVNGCPTYADLTTFLFFYVKVRNEKLRAG
jgi:hypothetical protein